MIKKSPLTTIVAMALTTLLLLLSSCGKKQTTTTKGPIRVKTEEVSLSGGNYGKQYVGIVEEREATAVSFTSMGVVRRVLVDEGQYVSRGQLLAEMDATTMDNSVEVARASTSQAHDMVAQAQSAYDQAKDAYDRMKLLHDNGSLPEMKWIEVETRLQQAETALRTAQAGVKSANAAEKIARKGQADTRLVAPVSGIIGSKHLVAGETALPSQAVVTILDISSVKVKVSIPETEMRSLGSHTSSYIEVEAAGARVGGGLIEKGVKADALTHTYDVRVHVPNTDHRILPGMVANVMFTGEGGHGILTVPVTCVQKKSDGSLFVWTIGKDSTAHRTKVETGLTQGNRLIIKQGVTAGTRVVVEGYQKLSEGSKVKY
ncbi:MAG: efflux RND transporter periplasmic adaptor subunit [Prevotella sp.]|nr:efflux RND transporter periplasmic adaptor subunit [Prevotella sp.]